MQVNTQIVDAVRYRTIAANCSGTEGAECGRPQATAGRDGPGNC